jgi:hypothetical protein
MIGHRQIACTPKKKQTIKKPHFNTQKPQNRKTKSSIPAALACCSFWKTVNLKTLEFAMRF